uniref:hypothetical protein n=1 Tax=Phymatolithon calcareum TaxID=1277942 RepID=UPI0023EFD096|nr:hypothetical protein P6G74_pgp051 [Phymatolithon calcareum]WEA76917.1 hypothetical protein [Phymatolithon calcareum]
MKRNRMNSWPKIPQGWISFVFWVFVVISTIIIAYLSNRNSSYSFFIEFNNANGISKGTPVRIRGINIGSIQSLKIQPNCVLTLATINSSNIFIPKDSIIETNQTGLLNEAVIDIIPLVSVISSKDNNFSPFSDNCENSKIICNKMYVTGDRGLNYDDLVRSTTRISQRFDDPRFFNLFYVFLQNGIELTDVILELMMAMLDITSVSYIYLQKFLSST